MSRPTQYRVSFIPVNTLQYDYEVEAKNEDEAFDKATEHMNNSGYDPTTDELNEISRQITASQCLDD